MKGALQKRGLELLQLTVSVARDVRAASTMGNLHVEV